MRNPRVFKGCSWVFRVFEALHVKTLEALKPLDNLGFKVMEKP